eukprot:scaffold2858_cov659-Pavlova_lutheri.AAC.53
MPSYSTSHLKGVPSCGLVHGLVAHQASGSKPILIMWLGAKTVSKQAQCAVDFDAWQSVPTRRNLSGPAVKVLGQVRNLQMPHSEGHLELPSRLYPASPECLLELNFASRHTGIV